MSALSTPEKIRAAAREEAALPLLLLAPTSAPTATPTTERRAGRPPAVQLGHLDASPYREESCKSSPLRDLRLSLISRRHRKRASAPAAAYQPLATEFARWHPSPALTAALSARAAAAAVKTRAESELCAMQHKKMVALRGRDRHSLPALLHPSPPQDLPRTSALSGCPFLPRACLN